VQKYHDFILAQGLVPPKLLRQALLESFVPAQKKALAETAVPASHSGASSK